MKKIYNTLAMAMMAMSIIACNKMGSEITYDNLLDSCDEIREGDQLGHKTTNRRFMSIDTKNKKEGAGCYSFDLHLPFTKLSDGQEVPAYGNDNDYLGQFMNIYNTPVAVPEGMTLKNGILRFWFYIDDARIINNASLLRVEISSEGSDGWIPDNHLQWDLRTINLKNGWNSMEFNFADCTTVESLMTQEQMNKGINYFRMYIYDMNGKNPCAHFTVKFDAIQFLLP